jgi:hyperosmotically inducible protein
MRAPRRWRQVVMGFGLVVTIGGCASADPLEDTRIEADVKARLVGKKGANLTEIGVSSANAIVYLTGAVESVDQKAQAEALARGVKEVRRVVNFLEVRSLPK